MTGDVRKQARLFAKYGPFRGLDVELGPVTTIGRAEDNDVVLTDPAISHHHARIELGADRRYTLSDSGSSNGTEVDGFPVRGVFVLGEIAVIGLAGVGELIFSAPAPEAGELGDRTVVEEDESFLHDVLARIGNAQAGSPDRTLADAAAPVLPPALGGPPAPDGGPLAPDGARTPPPAARTRRFVLVVETPRGDRRFPLTPGSHVVGRGADAEIRIEHPHLSRSHARIEVGATVVIEDLGSRNLTQVGDRDVDGRMRLKPGDRLRLGDLRAWLVEEKDSE